MKITVRFDIDNVVVLAWPISRPWVYFWASKRDFLSLKRDGIFSNKCERAFWLASVGSRSVPRNENEN